MKVIQSSKSVQKIIQQLKLKNKTVGFVPTMGALHEGHLSLVRKSRRENDITIVSIFVNPIQFGRNEDLAVYPREEKKDKMLLQKEKVDLLFYPSVEEMYPKGYKTHVEVSEYDKVLCGRIRPGHFKGVTTVVAKLLNIVLPDNLYLGQKDAQQAIIIGKMVQDLNFPVKLHVCPTMREPDGLAMSSRNVFLKTKERQEAPILYQALKAAKHSISNGLKQPHTLIKNIQQTITKHSSGTINYIECVDAETLSPVKVLKGKILIALSVTFGSTKLIDNIMVNA